MSERYRLVVTGLRRGQECGGGSLRLEAGQTAAPSCLLGLLAAPPTTPGPSPFRVSPAVLPPLKLPRSASITASPAFATRTPVPPGGSLLLSSAPRPRGLKSTRRPTVTVQASRPASCPPQCVLPALPLSAEASVFLVNSEEIKRGLPESAPNQLTVHLDLGPWI